MSVLALRLDARRDRLGLKGPRAEEWLRAQGIALPMAANSWTYSHQAPAAATAPATAAAPAAPSAGAVLVARLGAAEFFLEDEAGGTTIERISPWPEQPRGAAARGAGPPAGAPPGVYPVLREDWAFHLGGDGVHEVLTQVCNVNFAALALDSRPVIMTLMIGVAVLIVPRSTAAAREYRIWCDPTFGPYLTESLAAVVSECGGGYTGVST
jgi:sarcosine oxidase subunit gamma